MNLFPEQQDAVNQIKSWLVDTNIQRQLKLGGYAGTGKTTVIKSLLETLDEDIAVAAFTGKAVSVLRKKGVESAQTLHSLLYTTRMVNKKLVHTLRDELEDNPELIIVDEASMISGDLYDDLISFNIPVLWVGDPGQLEPVGSDVGLMKSPDIILDVVHRQGEGSQILSFANALRFKEEPRSYKSTNETEVKLLPRSKMRTIDCDQIICGFNKTRIFMNRQVRKQAGYTDLVHVGEKLVVLKNQSAAGVFNGMLVTVTKVGEIKKSVITLELKDELDNSLGEVNAYIPQFGSEKTVDHYELKIESIRTGLDLVLLDYGYCLTGHKSQGSEWDRVVVIEEIWKEKWEASRWRYTTATRAAKELTYYY